MDALTLYIIRHAEKPDGDPPVSTGPGLTHKGEQNKESLVIRGWERAGAWTALFGTGLGDQIISGRRRSMPRIRTRLNRIRR